MKKRKVVWFICGFLGFMLAGCGGTSIDAEENIKTQNDIVNNGDDKNTQGDIVNNGVVANENVYEQTDKREKTSEEGTRYVGGCVLSGYDLQMMLGLVVNDSFDVDIFLPVELVLHDDNTGTIELYLDKMLPEMRNYLEKNVADISYQALLDAGYSKDTIEQEVHDNGFATTEEYFENYTQEYMKTFDEVFAPGLQNNPYNEFVYEIDKGTSAEMPELIMAFDNLVDQRGFFTNDGNLKLEWEMVGMGGYWITIYLKNENNIDIQQSTLSESYDSDEVDKQEMGVDSAIDQQSDKEICGGFSNDDYGLFAEIWIESGEYYISYYNTDNGVDYLTNSILNYDSASGIGKIDAGDVVYTVSFINNYETMIIDYESDTGLSERTELECEWHWEE